MNTTTTGGMAAVAYIRSRRGRPYSADMAAYMRQLSEENTNADSLDKLKRNLLRCLREDITPVSALC